MRTPTTRFTFVALIFGVSGLLVSACAGTDEGVFEDQPGVGGSAGAAGSGGTTGGSSTGGTVNGGNGGTVNGGTGGTVNGGAGGTANGGTGNAGAGGSGNGGSGNGGSGNGGAMGTCNPAFCPSSGFGTACCVTQDGPCGYDTGMGCQQSTGDV